MHVCIFLHTCKDQTFLNFFIIIHWKRIPMKFKYFKSKITKNKKKKIKHVTLGNFGFWVFWDFFQLRMLFKSI